MSDEGCTITLGWAELMQAAMCGIYRHIASLKDRRQDRFGANTEDGWTLHIEGAAGELAFAKAANRYWGMTLNAFSEPDVGAVQVRTRSRPEYELIVRDGDADSDVFVCVTGRAPTFDVRGWILGRDAKRKEWRQAHGGRTPAYFVPHDALRSIDELQLSEEVRA